MAATSATSSVPAIAPAPTLDDHIADLAQELQNMILHEYILSIPSNGIVKISASYHPQNQLQINKATRHTAARQHYTTNSFNRGDGSICAFLKWLDALSVEHSLMIASIPWRSVYPCPGSQYHRTSGFMLDLLRRARNVAEHRGTQLNNDCLKIGLDLDGSKEASQEDEKAGRVVWQASAQIAAGQMQSIGF